MEKEFISDHIYNKRIQSLRGVMAVVVLLSHIWYYSQVIFLVPFNKIVTIAVAFFFFCSGWGMSLSAEKDPRYGRKIMRKKLPQLLFLGLLGYLLGTLIEAVLPLAIHRPVPRMYLPFGVRRLVLSMNWYVYELAAFYCLFFAALKLFARAMHRTLFVAVISIAAFFVLYRIGAVEAWYNSLCGFPLGMFCASYGVDSRTVGKNRKTILGAGILICVLCFGAMIIPGIDKTSWYFSLIRNLAAVGFIMIILCLVLKVDTAAGGFVFLTAISAELYFCHIPVTTLLGGAGLKPEVYCIAALGLTAVCTAAMKWININVTRKIFRG